MSDHGQEESVEWGRKIHRFILDLEETSKEGQEKPLEWNGKIIERYSGNCYQSRYQPKKDYGPTLIGMIVPRIESCKVSWSFDGNFSFKTRKLSDIEERLPFNSQFWQDGSNKDYLRGLGKGTFSCNFQHDETIRMINSKTDDIIEENQKITTASGEGEFYIEVLIPIKGDQLKKKVWYSQEVLLEFKIHSITPFKASSVINSKKFDQSGKIRELTIPDEQDIDLVRFQEELINDHSMIVRHISPQVSIREEYIEVHGENTKNGRHWEFSARAPM